MFKTAIVTYQFYKTVTRGGERHLLLLARILQDFSDVTIITTQSTSHRTWKNENKNKIEFIDKRIKVVRHPVDFQIKLRQINNLNHYLHGNTNHTIGDETDWMNKIGPYSSELFEYLRKNKDKYDLFFFNSHANPVTYFGLPIVKKRSVLIPFCHEEPSSYFKIFDDLFVQPRLIMANTQTETESIHKHYNRHSPIITVGINIEDKTNLSFNNISRKFYIKKPYVLFIGRTERNKGIFELIENYNELLKFKPDAPDLVIIGEKIYTVKTGKKIKFLNGVNDQEKLAVIKNSLFVINPSFYESLSLVLLESWSQKIPVLVNAWCSVLKKQVEYSQGGLYYENFTDFADLVKLLVGNKTLRNRLGDNGYQFYLGNYTKEIIKKKISILVKNLTN